MTGTQISFISIFPYHIHMLRIVVQKVSEREEVKEKGRYTIPDKCSLI